MTKIKELHCSKCFSIHNALIAAIGVASALTAVTGLTAIATRSLSYTKVPNWFRNGYFIAVNIGIGAAGTVFTTALIARQCLCVRHRSFRGEQTEHIPSEENCLGTNNSECMVNGGPIPYYDDSLPPPNTLPHSSTISSTGGISSAPADPDHIKRVEDTIEKQINLLGQQQTKINNLENEVKALKESLETASTEDDKNSLDMELLMKKGELDVARKQYESLIQLLNTMQNGLQAMKENRLQS